MDKLKIMKKCKCTYYGGGFLSKECNYHQTHCHHLGCKKKLKKGEKEYCKKHEEYWKEESKYGVDAYGGSNF